MALLGFTSACGVTPIDAVVQDAEPAAPTQPVAETPVLPTTPSVPLAYAPCPVAPAELTPGVRYLLGVRSTGRCLGAGTTTTVFEEAAISAPTAQASVVPDPASADTPTDPAASVATDSPVDSATAAGGADSFLEAYTAELSTDCSPVDRRLWELSQVPGYDPPQYQLLQVETEYNLDIAAARTNIGTPAILYRPHMGANQRFLIRPRDEFAFELAPVHVDTLCLSDGSSRTSIWQCAPNDAGQSWLLSPEVCP